MAALRIGDIERLLFERFPGDAADIWDRCGLLVGDPTVEISGIAVALDPTVDAIEEAAARGCNLLLTHHPVFIEPPTVFVPDSSPVLSSGAAVYAAVAHGVALIAMHTNLDRSPAARSVLLEPLGLVFRRPLERVDHHTSDGGSGSIDYAACGQIATIDDASGERSITLEELVVRCHGVFGSVPRVWGDAQSTITSVAVCGGSAKSFLEEVLVSATDCLIVGELGYHDALGLVQAGVALIELGHDVSELPYRSFLKEVLLSFGLEKSKVHVLEPTATWWQPMMGA